MRTWQIQEAKAQFSELVRDTERSGPQEITWHGRSAVVMSKADYERLSGADSTLVELGGVRRFTMQMMLNSSVIPA
jgi:prevent-host-death family protein